MAKTTLLEYGTSVIIGSQGDEEIIPALGDGTAKPGNVVGITSGGKVVQSDLGAVEDLIGILMESQITGQETAIVDTVLCDVVIPKSGNRYVVRIDDQGGAKEIGYPLEVTATAGTLGVADDVNNALAVLGKPIANGDTVAEIIWR